MMGEDQGRGKGFGFDYQKLLGDKERCTHKTQETQHWNDSKATRQRTQPTEQACSAEAKAGLGDEPSRARHLRGRRHRGLSLGLAVRHLSLDSVEHSQASCFTPRYRPSGYSFSERCKEALYLVIFFFLIKRP